MAKKQEIMLSEPLVPDTITDYLDNGADVLQGDYYDQFLRDMMVVGMDTFNKVLDIACQDEKLRADIFAKLSKGVHQVTQSNDTLAQQTIQSLRSNIETIQKNRTGWQGVARGIQVLSGANA